MGGVRPRAGQGNEDGRIGELTLFRLREDTGFSPVMAADDLSSDLLHIAETVFGGDDTYSLEFHETVEMPVTDAYASEAKRKIAALWQSIGFRPFKDVV
ncbi:hypothetical protein [Streptomyces sp. NBC_00134]|uniref:hypothetical protein n=1 Tax=Streptomyces sp. NBC_00134 TaxID=2975663 RepID=UPI003255F918